MDPSDNNECEKNMEYTRHNRSFNTQAQNCAWAWAWACFILVYLIDLVNVVDLKEDGIYAKCTLGLFSSERSCKITRYFQTQNCVHTRPIRSSQTSLAGAY